MGLVLTRGQCDVAVGFGVSAEVPTFQIFRGDAQATEKPIWWYSSWMREADSEWFVGHSFPDHITNILPWDPAALELCRSARSLWVLMK